MIAFLPARAILFSGISGARGWHSLARDESAIGTVGVLTVATRGPDGPGEVWVKIRGGSERFLAWSERPLSKGVKVLITDFRGSRTVDVVEWNDPLGEVPRVPGGIPSREDDEPPPPNR